MRLLIGLLFFGLILYPDTSRAQTYSSVELVTDDQTVVAELDTLLSDLTEKQNYLPQAAYQIYSELQYITDELAKIAQLEAKYRNAKTRISQPSTFINEWPTRKNQLEDLSISDTGKLDLWIKRDLIPLYNDIITFDRNQYDLRIDFQGVYNLFAAEPLSSLLNTTPDATGSVPLTNETATDILSVLQEDVIREVEDVIRNTQAEQARLLQVYADITVKLESAKSSLEEYRTRLREEQKQINTKQSLESNLYLIILIIGVLSVAAIAVVRWFPDEVMLVWVESGQVIQFVTVMILLSAIMALGLAGLIQENTLGTLLGGIGGYVLSQGVGRSAARMAIKEREAIEKGRGGS